jgi:hypothetical protein
MKVNVERREKAALGVVVAVWVCTERGFLDKWR